MNELFHSKNDRVKLLELLQTMLQQEPQRFGITLDEFGATELQDVTLAAANQIPWATVEHIEELAKNIRNNLEIEGGTIRFRSGHHFAITNPVEIEPPELLYMCVNPIMANPIREQGASPILKRYLIMFDNPDEAWHHATAIEQIPSPTVITIEAHRAYKADIKFFQFERMYYSKAVPAKYIKQ